MSRYIEKYMNLEKSKRPTFWNGCILVIRFAQQEYLSNMHISLENAATICRGWPVDVPVVFDGNKRTDRKVFFYRFYDDWHEKNMFCKVQFKKAPELLE